jgi:hypothetical protein
VCVSWCCLDLVCRQRVLDSDSLDNGLGDQSPLVNDLWVRSSKDTRCQSNGEES